MWGHGNWLLLDQIGGDETHPLMGLVVLGLRPGSQKYEGRTASASRYCPSRCCASSWNRGPAAGGPEGLRAPNISEVLAGKRGISKQVAKSFLGFP